MAQLFPSLDIIDKLKIQPTKGERCCIDFLSKHLDDNYEIFYQPYLNGDRPDIVIMKEHSGVMIIEVKDWKLRNYYLDNNLNWRLKENDAYILPPLKQVLNYKQNLFDLHIEELNELYRKDKNIFGIVSCAIYFHNENERDLINFHRNGIDPTIHHKYLNELNYFEFLGADSFNVNRLNTLLSKRHLNIKRTYFNDNLYKSFKRYLQPPFHYSEDGKEILYTQEQLELSRSEIRPRRKVKGIAGCGKTLVLAKRAVNAHKRTGGRVLILTYNLSLKNYIHDRISDVKENFSWDYFKIINYHQFFISNATNHNLLITNLEDFDNPRFFEIVKSELEKFDVILIDEIQDYKTEWQRLIHDYFLTENGEYCVFGDEKQNIYSRELDINKEPFTVGIPGAFNRSLNRTFRFSPEITHLADNFQKTFFNNKYDLDQIDYSAQVAMDFSSKIKYYYFKNTKGDATIINTLFNILIENCIHSSDVAILCSKVDFIRNLEYQVRTMKHEKTERTFESKEEYDTLVKVYTIKKENGQNIIDKENMNMKLDQYRRLKKFNFWNKSGKMKFSTIHSYKGWETHSLFLILENEIEDNESWTVDELVYTAITRCRYNLFVFNLENKKYDDFFTKNISAKKVIE